MTSLQGEGEGGGGGCKFFNMNITIYTLHTMAFFFNLLKWSLFNFSLGKGDEQQVRKVLIVLEDISSWTRDLPVDFYIRAFS